MASDSLLSDGQMAFLLGGLLLLLLGLRKVLPRRRRVVTPQAPTGVGAALACALDGDLETAQRLLENRVRAQGADPDVILGLLAVLRAGGRHARAAALAQALARRQPAPWLTAATVRICLDAGQPGRAATWALASPVPLDLRVAACARAGRFEDAASALVGRTGRKERTPEQIASVLALLALRLAHQGDERGSWRRLKRALTDAPDAIAVLVACERLHPKPAERARAMARLAERCGRTSSEVPGIEEGSPVARARTALHEGRVEAALGLLRDHLDTSPQDDVARRQYEAWLVLHGEPADWRSALAERSERVPAPVVVATEILVCGHCGLELAEPVFLCPRCDRFDTLRRATERPIRGGVRPSAVGARLIDLVPEALSRTAS